MTVWAHFSQRSTCPPSAAVRQRSMAVITFSWSRLTWPALAQRHAAPWSRKISATSSAGRDTVGGGYAGGCSSLFLSSVFLGFLRFGRASRSSGRPVVAEDIRNLQRRAGHSRRRLRRGLLLPVLIFGFPGLL